MTATLADFPDRRNSLNFIRLVLAALVIVSHAWPIGGFGPEPALGGFTLGHFAVAGFFAISGWLITQSRLGGEFPGYAWRRFVRIYPGFLVALIVVGLGFAPVGAAVAGTPYNVTDGVRYVLGNSAMYVREYSVGATLPSSAFPAWNGSLWTLFHEVLCYVIVGFLVTFVGRRFVLAGVAAMWAATSAVEILVPAAALPGPGAAFVSLAPFFFAGSLLFLLRSRVPLNGWSAVLSLVWLAGVVVLDAPSVVAAFPIAHLALWAGRTLPAHRLCRTHDISYGTYVYAFPVQQLLALAGGASWGVGVYVLISIGATLPFAAASWFCVERPALRYKGLFDRFPFVRSGWTVRRRPHMAPA